MIIILTTLNLLCLSILLTGIFIEDGIIKISILATTVFSSLYVIVSGLFFWFDAFDFTYVLGLILICTVSLTILLTAKKIIHIKRITICNSILTTEIILIVIAFLLSFQNFELYSAQQDQGLYQAEAIELYMGNYEVEHDFEEYKILENEEDKVKYQNMLTSDTGYYPLSQYYERIGFEMSNPVSDVSGMYHGIQTFPAILALGGRLFGLKNMMQIQTIFLVCSVLLLYYALCNMGINPLKRLGTLSVFLLSPLVLWISKTAFTEMILTLCISFYLFLLTEANTMAKRYILVLPLLAFSFIHVSFLIIYPIFILINILLFFQTRQKEYIWINLICSVGLSVSYSMMAHIAPQYLFDNISRLFFKNIITINNFLYWIYIGCILMSVCSLFILRMKDQHAIYQIIIKICKVSPFFILIFLGIIVFHVVVIGYYRTPEDGWRKSLCSYYGKGFLNAFSHSSFFAFAMATGFLIIFCVLLYVIRYYNSIWNTPIETAVYFLFLYCILFQSAFIRKEVYYYYYYSRYLVIYIPIICIAFALLFKQIKGRSLWIIWIFSVVSMIIFDVPLLREKDETLLEWETLQDLEIAIQDDSAIILDSNMAKLLGLTVRAVSGEAIFPIMHDKEDEIELLKEHYSNIYYLSSEAFRSACQTLDVADLEIIYRDRYLRQETRVLKGYFPIKYSSNIRELSLYKIKRSIDYFLNSAPKDLGLFGVSNIYGFSFVESNGRWICEDKASIECNILPDDYQLTVSIDWMPLERLGVDEYTASVYINDIYLGDIVIPLDNHADDYQFDIPKEYMENGSNIISIYCEKLWSPSDYGSADTRSLGIFIQRIKLTPANR